MSSQPTFEEFLTKIEVTRDHVQRLSFFEANTFYNEP